MICQSSPNRKRRPLLRLEVSLHLQLSRSHPNNSSSIPPSMNLQRASLHTLDASRPRCLSPYVHVSTLTERLQSFNAPGLHTSILCLHIAGLQHFFIHPFIRYTYNVSRPLTPYLHTFTSSHLQRASRAPFPRDSISRRLQRTS